jgi:hypothetical protein
MEEVLDEKEAEAGRGLEGAACIPSTTGARGEEGAVAVFEGGNTRRILRQ